MKKQVDVFSVVFAALMAALAIILGFFAVPGPWNIKFGLTAIPILISAFVLGPIWGLLTGLVGGLAQAINYGSIWYIFYTAIQGFVAGFFSRHFKATRISSPAFGFLGGFFIVWWVDLLRTGQHTFAQLTSGSAVKLFDMERGIGLPYVGLLGGVVCGTAFFVIGTRATPRSIRHLALAGCIAAVAYVPYDAFVLYKIQDYPWIPTWFVLGKDLAQDFLAAFLCAWIYTNPRIAKMLAGRGGGSNAAGSHK